VFTKPSAIKMTLEVTEGELTKRTDLELHEADELQKIQIIHNVFEVFGVNKDLQDIAETYLKIGKAYKSFFEKVEPIEAPSEKLMPLKLTDDENPSELAQQLQSKLQEQQPAIENKYSKGKLAEAYNTALNNEQPEYYTTGIKVENGISKYKTRLHCDCGNQVNRYLPKNTKRVACRDCGREHNVRWAKKGYLERDKNGNFFIAGKFVGDDEAE
jgi:hypothetical protein